MVGSAPAAPSNVSVTPSSGSGASGTFSFTSSSPDGAGYIAQMQMMFNYGVDGGRACYLSYSAASNLLYLYGDQGPWEAPANVGAVGTLSNSQCSVNLAASSVSGSVDALTLNLAISFNYFTFIGPQNIYQWTGDSDGQYTPGSKWVRGPPTRLRSPRSRQRCRPSCQPPARA